MSNEKKNLDNSKSKTKHGLFLHQNLSFSLISICLQQYKGLSKHLDQLILPKKNIDQKVESVVIKVWVIEKCRLLQIHNQTQAMALNFPLPLYFSTFFFFFFARRKTRSNNLEEIPKFWATLHRNHTKIIRRYYSTIYYV